MDVLMQSVGFNPEHLKSIDSAFIDRIHAFNPGWDVAPVRHELFCTGSGFVVDCIAEVIKHLRTEDYTGPYKPFFEISSDVSTRDQTGFEKTFSGLMKILHPDGKASKEEMAELLEFAEAVSKLRGATTPRGAHLRPGRWQGPRGWHPVGARGCRGIRA